MVVSLALEWFGCGCSHRYALALAHASRGGKCNSRVPSRSKSGGAAGGLHKRTAEGGYCARQGRSPSGGLLPQQRGTRRLSLQGALRVSPQRGWRKRWAGCLGRRSSGKGGSPSPGVYVVATDHLPISAMNRGYLTPVTALFRISVIVWRSSVLDGSKLRVLNGWRV